MSTLLSAKEICERALRLIGAFSIVDTQADAAEMDEALRWLDLIVAELSGIDRIAWLLPSGPARFALVAGQISYDITAALGATAPKNGVQFVRECWIEDAYGERIGELAMVDRLVFEENQRPSNEGTPQACFIDRLTRPTIHMDRKAPADLVAESLFVGMVVQTYGDSFAGSTGIKPAGIHAAWQKWAIYELASNIGQGPVRRVSSAEIRDFKTIADDSRKRLLGFQGSQNLSLPQISEFRDF